MTAMNVNPTVDPISCATIEELYARQQITEVLVRWARAADLRDPITAASYFTDDCTVDYGPRFPQGPLQGRRAYEAYMAESMGSSSLTAESRSLVRTTGCSHHISTVEIHFVTMTEASVRSVCFSWTDHLNGGTRLHWSAFYDRFTKDDSSTLWLIAERRNSLIGEQRRS